MFLKIYITYVILSCDYHMRSCHVTVPYVFLWCDCTICVPVMWLYHMCSCHVTVPYEILSCDCTIYVILSCDCIICVPVMWLYHMRSCHVTVYNYQPCKSVIWRIVSQRKIIAWTFEGRQSVISHSYKVDNCFITLNILHSAIIIWSSSNLTTVVVVY